MLALVPICPAYGDDYEGGGGTSSSFNNSFGTVWYGPTASGLYVRYGVVANTKYDAALYCCKGRNFDLSDLSNKKKSKLLKNGDFKQFADLFNVGKPELTDDWGGDASVVQAWNSARQLYGETYCWNARYTNDQKIRAQEAIEDILNDDDTPSGGGTGSGSSDVSMRIPLYYVGNGDAFAGEEVTLQLNSDFVASFQSYLERDSKKYWAVTINQNSGDLNIWVASQDFTLWMGDDGYIDYFAFDGNASLANSIYSHNYTISGSTVTLNATSFGSPWGKGLRYDGGIEKYVYGQSNVSYCSNKNRSGSEDGPIGGGGGGGGGDEPEPPIDWPAPPTETPKPPDVPTPGDPTEPNPWIPIPDDDINITGDDFQDLLDALNEHCIHLQNSIESNVSQLWDLQSDFFGSAFEDLKSYLHELFEWLSEQLNFDVTVEGGQYDDTSVLYWLKQIWAKLPTGINTKPSDPVTNPDGWWDWLTQLLNNLAADLMALGHDKLAGILETLNELRNKFPFSLPWDVAALLGLLVGVPECPEFDMPCYAVSLEGLQQVGTYHITLEPYETVWEGVKWIETLAFAVYLIMNTGGLMDMVSKTVRPR